MAFVYMLECADGSFYVGSTVKSLQARLWEHQQGLGAAYTARRLPVRLVWHEEHEHIALAFGREKQIQNWGRPKRIALIEQRYDDLPGLARRRGKKPRP
jgi:putative endonuclease